jgi:hypothetical protein
VRIKGLRKINANMLNVKLNLYPTLLYRRYSTINNTEDDNNLNKDNKYFKPKYKYVKILV